MSALLAFVAVAAVVIVTPGQDTALTIRNTLVGGRGAGLATALGVSTGLATWALATSAGLAAVVVASERLFLAIKLVGAAYLVLLGAQAVWRGITGREPHALGRKGGPLTSATAYRQGVLSNLGNPKIAVFFTSLLPQFAADGGSFAALFGLGVVFCAMTATWLACYALAVDRASSVLRRRSVRRALDAITGFVLVALGLRLAAERR